MFLQGGIYSGNARHLDCSSKARRDIQRTILASSSVSNQICLLVNLYVKLLSRLYWSQGQQEFMEAAIKFEKNLEKYFYPLSMNGYVSLIIFFNLLALLRINKRHNYL